MAREKNPTTTPTPKKPRARKARGPVPTQATAPAPFVGPEQRAALIAEAAYYRAERRGFAPGGDMEDWFAAEAEVDARLLHAAPPGEQSAS